MIAEDTALSRSADENYAPEITMLVFAIIILLVIFFYLLWKSQVIS